MPGNLVSVMYTLYRCVRDQTFRLCEECDKVFHKAALKRPHIRLPVCMPCLPSLRAGAGPRGDSTQDGSLAIQQRLQQCLQVITQESRSSYGTVTQSLSVLHSEKLLWSNLSEMNTWREVTSAVLLQSMLNVIQDKKVSVWSHVFPAICQ